MSSLWIAAAADLASNTPLPDSVDVAVIGGGIAGVSVALHLAQAGVSVALLERQTIASRASGRNDGQLLLGLGEHYHRIHGQFGSERAQLLWAFLASNHDLMIAALREHRIDCDLQTRGGLRLAQTEHEWLELQEAAAVLTAEHKRHTLIPQRELPHWLPPAVGFHGALHLPGEAIVQPAQMVRGLAAAAVRHGATLAEHTPVLAVRGDAGAFTLELAGDRSLRACAVVHCTSTLARELDPTGLLTRTVFPFRGQILATDPLPAELAAQFGPHAMSSNFCYEYFRMAQGRFVIGGKRWSVKGEELGIVDDDSHNPQITANLLGYVRDHFPCLRDAPFPHVWTGIMAGTPDGLPLLGALPGRPGTFVLGAFNGYGLSFAFLAGRCLAEMVVDGRCAEPAAAMFAPRRFDDATR